MIIAGEASGDLHGGALVRALKDKSPQLEIFGIGGDNMQAAGMKLFYHVNDLAYVGFTEVAKHYFFFHRVFYNMLEIVKMDGKHVGEIVGINLDRNRGMKSRYKCHEESCDESRFL